VTFCHPQYGLFFADLYRHWQDVRELVGHDAGIVHNIHEIDPVSFYDV